METFGLPQIGGRTFEEMAICRRRDEHDDTISLWVDTKKAKFVGKPWSDLSDFARRKFDNRIILEWPKLRLNVHYR